MNLATRFGVCGKVWPLGMLRARHTSPRQTWLNPHTRVATVVLTAMMLLAGPPALAQAQAPELAEADTATAYRQVEGWTRLGQVPEDDELLNSPITGLLGVRVTLRDGGDLVGTGDAVRPDLSDCVDQQGPAVDMTAMLAQATRAALADSLEKGKRRAVELGIVQPELFAQMMAEQYRRTVVDIQLAHNLESVLLPPNAADGAIFAHFAPGYHGLRMTGPLMPEGDLLWPASALARNTSPISQLRQLLTRQGFDQDDIPIICRIDGPQLERFSVYHMAKASVQQPARLYTRGNILVGQQILDSQALDSVVDRVARHLEAKLQETDQQGVRMVRGAYHPSHNRIDPDLAESRQVALLCYTMMLQCETAFSRDPGNAEVMIRAQKVAEVIRTYAPMALPEGEPTNHLTAAFMLMAINHGPVEVDAGLRGRLAEAVLAMRHPEGGFRAARDNDARLSRATASVLTAALADHYMESGDARFGDAAWTAMGELFTVNQDDALMVDLTWLSIAMNRAGQRLAGAAEDPDAMQKLADYRALLADQTSLLIDQQVKATPLLGPADVIGGFILTPGPPGSPPNPTWQSAMPLAIIALSLQDPDIIAPARVHGPILSAGLGARFIAQLMLTRTNGYYLRDLEKADGGIRNTLWDNTLYLDCSTMALLALTQFQGTLDELQRREDAGR